MGSARTKQTIKKIKANKKHRDGGGGGGGGEEQKNSTPVTVFSFTSTPCLSLFLHLTKTLSKALVFNCSLCFVV